MWIIAGVLLGVVVLASLIGFHTGPHTHLAAGAVGILAAIWLVAMAVDGRSSSLVWPLFAADLVVSAGVGIMGWYGLSHEGPAGLHPGRLEGAEGVAVSELAPDGIVRVRGEQWSAHAVNGPVAAGTPVQVLRATGVHLEVWGEDPAPAPSSIMGNGPASALHSEEKSE